MLRYTLKSFWAHKRRLVSTFVAIVLGVGFVAGAMVLGNTLNRAYDDIFAAATQGTDAFVRSANAVGSDFGEQRARIDSGLADQVGRLDGVAAAEPVIATLVQLVGPDGEPVRDTAFGPPTTGERWGEVDELNPWEVVQGDPPALEDDVVIDRLSAERRDIGISDPVTLIANTGPVRMTVSGIATIAGQDSLGGAGTVLVAPIVAEELLSEPGRADGIAVVGAGDLAQEELVDRIEAGLAETADAPDLEVITGAELTEENQSAIGEIIDFITLVPLVFALISLVTGLFIIANTFAILLAQRSREMALLRAVGASRGQVVRSVLSESLLLGLVASTGGVGFGLVVAIVLRRFAGGGNLPPTPLVLTPTVVMLSISVGVLITMAASVLPAWKASRVPPVAAMRDVAIEDTRASRLRLAAGVVAVGAGVATVLAAVFGAASEPAIVAGVGVGLVLLGTILVGPALAGPLGRALGAPLPRVAGVAGKLARQNSIRSPRRTAATASALLVGVAVVGFVVVFVASLRATITSAIDLAFAGDLVVDSGIFNVGGFAPDVADRIDGLDDVDAATGLRTGQVDVDGDSTFGVAIDAAVLAGVVDIGVTDGSLANLADGQIAIGGDVAAERAWTLGDAIEVRFPETGTQTVTVAALFDRAEVLGPFLFDLSLWAANVPNELDNQILVNLADGVDPERATAAIEDIVADYPTARVLDATAFKEQISGQVNGLLALVFILLSMAFLIALLGIANALSLSVHERTRELGLLRAVGMTRPQLRRMVRWEAAVVAVLGTVLGLVVGVFFGWAMVRALRDEGIDRFAVGPGLLAAVVAASAVAGILAAPRPAYRAARLNVLAAIAYE
ncbi:MAG: ABC transporter permease [Acidimicrobiales bacterium]